MTYLVVHISFKYFINLVRSILKRKMSSVHYKFKSSLDYDTLTFDGLSITLGELKKAIAAKKLGKNTDFDLQITNAQTKEGKIKIWVHQI